MGCRSAPRQVASVSRIRRVAHACVRFDPRQCRPSPRRPGAAHRSGQVRRRPRRAGHARTWRSCGPRSRTPTWSRSTSPTRCRCRAWSACTTPAATTSGCRRLQQFPAMPETLEPARVRRPARCASSATSSPRSWPTPARRRSTRPSASSSTTTRCRRSSNPLDALAPDAPLLFAEHGSNVCFGQHVPGGGRRRSARRRRGRSPRSRW